MIIFLLGGDASSLQALSRNGTIDNISTQEVVLFKQQQDRLRLDYERKLADIEKERITIEEEKAQVDRYKQLLLKQRDIMIALTQRLVERDEQIMALQVHNCTQQTKHLQRLVYMSYPYRTS
jgi:hypothetical protein